MGSEVQVLPGPPSVGDVAQLVEHLLCKQGVVGSIPSISTRFLDDRSEGKASKSFFFEKKKQKTFD